MLEDLKYSHFLIVLVLLAWMGTPLLRRLKLVEVFPGSKSQSMLVGVIHIIVNTDPLNT